jgi:phosphatidylserine decarboxylase
VSPADGRVVRVQSQNDRQILSIFLSPLDVHINRAPIAGVISKREYRKGNFRAAYDDRASVENERLNLAIRGRDEVEFSLIAGILARRIKVWKKAGDSVSKGDRIGLIRFGSRVDLFLPSVCRVVVAKGDRVRGGSSILAYWSETP